MPDLGTKYECVECGTKFYDLGKPEPICPKCGTDQRQHQEKRGPVAEPRTRYVAPPAPAEDIEDDIPADIGDEDEEILVEPTDEDEEEEDDED